MYETTCVREIAFRTASSLGLFLIFLAIPRGNVWLICRPRSRIRCRKLVVWPTYSGACDLMVHTAYTPASKVISEAQESDRKIECLGAECSFCSNVSSVLRTFISMIRRSSAYF